MGLDTSHDAWHGAYSAFSRWRDKLAQVAGFTFHVHGEPFNIGGTGMQVVSTHRVMVDLDWGGIESTIGRDLLGKWPRMPVRHNGTPEPLIMLLAHSDCEGEIQSEFCGPLADRLEELVPLLGVEDGGGHIGMYAMKTATFIRGLRAAAEAGEDLAFF